MTAVQDMERLAHRFDELALRPQAKGIPTFRCPVCRNKVQNDATAMEPACTGPGSADVHSLTVMVRVADEQPTNMIWVTA